MLDMNIEKADIGKRLIMAGVIGFIFLIVMPKLVDSLEWLYYKHANLDNFIVYKQIIPEDICAGQLTQQWVIVREVKTGEKLALKADVVDEIYKLDGESNWVKYNGDYHFTPTYEYTKDGVSEFTFVYKNPLPVGDFKVHSQIGIFLPQNVYREAFVVESEQFKVRDCS